MAWRTTKNPDVAREAQNERLLAEYLDEDEEPIDEDYDEEDFNEEDDFEEVEVEEED